ncbi:uncharacterized protein YycO [Bacillus pakistanensis]|uniref:Uncharacterized protein YycO n=1 Tax=Rossellomorea pakistanensis TaxID=992288 RepID=A0ABS2N912_9BACI|nr:hypothetical protein [Bacillus pakistanensis]MBM7584051.1 uncharacterized protein YycO [Bacillus pakistanensis]
MELQTGDLLFIRGDFLKSPLIKWFLNSKYSHVAMVYDSTTICEVDTDKKMEIIPNPYQEFDVYRYIGNLTLEQQADMQKFLKEKCKTSEGYDWWRILSILLKRYFKTNLVIHQPNRYICSEIIDKAYQHIGIDVIKNRVTGDVTPVDLLHSSAFRKMDVISIEANHKTIG